MRINFFFHSWVDHWKQKQIPNKRSATDPGGKGEILALLNGGKKEKIAFPPKFLDVRAKKRENFSIEKILGPHPHPIKSFGKFLGAWAQKRGLISKSFWSSPSSPS